MIRSCRPAALRLYSPGFFAGMFRTMHFAMFDAGFVAETTFRDGSRTLQ
jgi:hypothetical protein